MSERTESAVTSQALQPESPIPTPEPPAAETATSSPAPEQEPTNPDVPKVTTGEVVAEYRKGQRGLAKHCLAAGEKAWGFVRYRVLVLKHDRAAAVKAVTGQLCDVAGRDVDVGRLIATFQAVRLLGDESGVDYSRVAYSTLEEYSVLVAREPKDETYTLVDGVQEDARALFREASTSEPPMPCRDVAKRVAVLDAKAKQLRADRLRQAAEDPKAGKAAKDRAVRAERQADKATAKLTRQEQPKGEQPQGETGETGKATGGEAKSKGQPSETGTRAESGPPVISVPDMVRPATAKNAADLLATGLLSHPNPSDVLERLLDMLDDAKEQLTPVAVRAVEAARMVFDRQRSRQSSPSPAAVAKAQSTSLPTPSDSAQLAAA